MGPRVRALAYRYAKSQSQSPFTGDLKSRLHRKLSAADHSTKCRIQDPEQENCRARSVPLSEDAGEVKGFARFPLTPFAERVTIASRIQHPRRRGSSRGWHTKVIAVGIVY